LCLPVVAECLYTLSLDGNSREREREREREAAWNGTERARERRREESRGGHNAALLPQEPVAVPAFESSPLEKYHLAAPGSE
jgi:hypothetical protein